ncbi:MAG: MerR family transcriptional regulator, partial [bacterium]
MADEPHAAALSVGAVAARLGVAPETLRSWGRRYGLLPSARSPGGHRRYSAADLDRLVRMQHLVTAGATPARAAREVQSPAGSPSTGLPSTGSPSAESQDQDLGAGPSPFATRRRPGGPGGRVLAVPGGSPQVRGLARAASRLDAPAISGIVGDLLSVEGSVTTWNTLLRPVLVAAGRRWAETGEGVEIEHTLSESIVDALRAHRAIQVRPIPGLPVLLACAPEDLHVLPLYVIAAALAEKRVAVHMLGARVPMAALASASRRTGASGVFIWRQIADDNGPRVDLGATRPRPLVVVGGPGWAGVDVEPGVHTARDLEHAVELLASAASPT